MSNREVIAFVAILQALLNVAVGGAMGNPIGAIALGVAIGAPSTAFIMWLVLRRIDAEQLPRARVVRASAAKRKS